VADLTPPLRRSPLSHRSAIAGEGGTVRLEERPFQRKYILRAEPQQAVEPLRSALGLGLPFDALTSSAAGETAFLWMGPDEWMLVTAAGDDASAERAAKALAGIHHQLVDVSDYYAAVELAGSRSRELLMKLTMLDLHPRAFPAGMVTGAIFGRANATIWQASGEAAEEGPAFRLFVRWSMADYLWCLIADAGRQWGLPLQRPLGGEKLTIASSAQAAGPIKATPNSSPASISHSRKSSAKPRSTISS
jgi:sarcosine oxidase subunit gamma